MTKITLSGGTTIELSAEQLRELGTKIAEAVEGTAEEKRLEVGDLAVVIDADGTDKEVGDIVRIAVSDDHNVFPYECDTSDYRRNQLRHATAEEVAEYEKSRIFTENGRKPNEYRKGDIVRYKSPFSTSVHEVSHISGEEVHLYDNSNGRKTEFSRISEGVLSPLVFVEQRLDRKH